MILKAPSKPLPAAYRPSGGESYKVKDKDSWITLATSRGVDPWWLIQYNFETRDPAEVNWYLKTRVGCVKTTPSGNFVFSAGAKPGTIYLPTPQMARSLKSAAYGKYGITIEGDEDYQRQVRTTLDWLARSDTGTVLLDGIKRTGKEVTISPFSGTDCNATAGAAHQNWADATAAGYPVLDGAKVVKEPSLVRDLLGLPKEPMLGTGSGSGSVVKFSPSMFGYGATGACSSLGGAPGASPSQVLFHELAHSYRQMSGACNRRPTIGTSTTYTNLEEFFAVVFTNVLIADPTYSSGNRTLRADHWGFVPLAPRLSTSRGFVSHIPNRNMVKELVAADPTLTKALGSVKSYFNPFAEGL